MRPGQIDRSHVQTKVGRTTDLCERKRLFVWNDKHEGRIETGSLGRFLTAYVNFSLLVCLVMNVHLNRVTYYTAPHAHITHTLHLENRLHLDQMKIYLKCQRAIWNIPSRRGHQQLFCISNKMHLLVHHLKVAAVSIFFVRP
jgi:hypothetical protein